MMRSFVALIGLFVALAVGPAAAQGKGPLVLAAASLQESMTAAADAWAKAGHPHPTVSFAASSALARQVEAGAPADLFASADEDWMNELQQKGLIAPGTRADWLRNQLVIVAPAATHVRMAMTGAAPFGIVYATDARASAAVHIVGVFPGRSHAPIVYPLARLKAATSPDAEGFRRFLLSGAGKAIFARYGFVAR